MKAELKEVKDEITTTMDYKEELKALETIFLALEPLQTTARRRIATYIIDRFNITWPNWK